MIDKDKIFAKLQLNPKDIIIPKWGKKVEVTVEELIETLYTHDKQTAAILGKSQGTLRKYLKQLFPELDLRTLANRSWESWLLGYTDYKRCSVCKEILSRDLFSKDKVTPDGLKHECKVCVKSRTTLNPVYSVRQAEHNKIKYQQNLEYNREWRRNYYQTHKEDYYARAAYRRARKLNATPAWADLDKIKEIYRNCPEGYEVDHIHPLQGKFICGLHVENNLQYLTVSENRSKGNKFNQEGASYNEQN